LLNLTTPGGETKAPTFSASLSGNFRATLSDPVPRRSRSSVWLLFSLILLGSPARADLAGTAAATVPPVATAAATAPAPAATAAPAGRLYVLMINGGGSRDDNYASHVAHLRELTARLLKGGVPNDRITILSSDGSNPAADFARRQPALENMNLLDGTALQKLLAEPLDFENSTVDGIKLLPATRATLSRWLRATRTWMKPADTLLVYVTDHGLDDPTDPLRNQITLWGNRAGIDVRQLATDLGQLPPGLRVVTVMSQCFSGGFAQLQRAVPQKRGLRATAWQGPTCGYFSTSADRPAYGCFPESSAEDRMGHAFTFIDALATRAKLPDVHAEVLVADRSPDVPLRSSDLFLAEVLAEAARIAAVDPEVLGDRLLAGPGLNPPAELDQATRVAKVYQFGSPPTLHGLRVQLDQLGSALDRATKQQTQWDDTVADANRTQLQRFMAANPRWRIWISPQKLRRMARPVRRKLTAELLTAIGAFTGTDPKLREQIAGLLDRADRTAALVYRMEVREAAWLRVRVLLTSAAARIHLTLVGTPEQRKQLADLDACEALAIPNPAKTGTTAPDPNKRPAPPKFSTPAEDQKVAQGLQPSWLGIAFRPPVKLVRHRLKLSEGAAVVTAVVPQSPAAAAGFVPGDIVVGEKGRAFTRPNEVRAFTMLAVPEKPAGIEIFRRGQRQVLEVKLTPAP
jgi:hypothetical protein